MARTLLQIFDDVIKLLGVETPNFSPMYVRERVVSEVNGALQMMSAAEQDYFTREKLNLNLTSGAPDYDLPEDLLHVVFPVRLADGTLLREIKNRGEYDLFGQIFLGQTAVQVSRDKPMAVFIEGLKRTDSATNTARSRVYFAPTPIANYTATLEITRRPASYTVEDLSDTDLTVPVPQDYCESILLPIVRWNVRTSNYFNRPEMLPALAQQFDAALRMLGLAGPQVDQAARSGNDRLEAAKQAARSAARQAHNAELSRQ